MKKIIILVVLNILTIIVNAQNPSMQSLKTSATTSSIPTDTTKKANANGWTKGVRISLGLTQVSNSNWVAAGGDKFSLSGAGALNAYASKKWGKNTWDNNLDINYGLVNTTTLGTRKINDLLSLSSKYGYKPNRWKNIQISLLGQLRSQLTNGYEYAYFGTTTQRKNSGFLTPAYIILAPGFDWNPTPWLSVFFSPAATRFTVIGGNPYSFVSPNGYFNNNKETPLATLYGVDSIKKVKTEFGAFLTLSLSKDIFKNVHYITKLDLYSNYLSKPENISMFWTNQFTFPVNKFIQVSYTLNLLYDDNVKNPLAPTHALGLEVLSAIGIGFALKY